MAAETGKDILGMSDDEFLKMPVPDADTVVEETTVDAGEVVQEPAVVDQPQTTQDDDEVDRQEPEVEGEPEKAPVVEPADKSVTEPAPKSDPVGSKEPKDTQAKPDTAVKTDDSELDYKALYTALMAPIKANGKTIELRSPEELTKLAQQGANYTRKMQELAPHRKVLLMLENNGLLDEAQLSYLIDLNKKDPEAIKKLVKESGLDPMDIDTEAEPTYRTGNHRVTDEEAAFRSTLDDISSFDEGRQTLQVINNTWDQASKELLFKDPGAMTLIHEHREAGVYDLISKEVEHQKTLGNVPANTSFIEAYKKVGDWMASNGRFDAMKAKQEPVAPKTPVAVTTAAVKAPVANNEKANAAAASRTGNKAAKPLVNPLAMSDEEFLKQFENRL